MSRTRALAVLFTDIVGSTALLNRLGPREACSYEPWARTTSNAVPGRTSRPAGASTASPGRRSSAPREHGPLPRDVRGRPAQQDDEVLGRAEALVGQPLRGL